MTVLANYIGYMLEDHFINMCNECPLLKSDFHDDGCDNETSEECLLNILWKNKEVMADAIHGLAFVQNSKIRRLNSGGSGKTPGSGYMAVSMKTWLLTNVQYWAVVLTLITQYSSTLLTRKLSASTRASRVGTVS